MRYAAYVAFAAIVFVGCQGPGYGVKEGEQKTEAGQPAGTSSTTPAASSDSPPGVPDKTPGFSIWSLSGGNKEFVRKRLDPGIGKPKTEQVTKMGEPVQCTPNPKGGEVCLWHDKGMAEGGTSEASMHQVYYSFDKTGVAREWDYRGVYGKLSSRDLAPDAQPPAQK